MVQWNTRAGWLAAALLTQACGGAGSSDTDAQPDASSTTELQSSSSTAPDLDESTGPPAWPDPEQCSSERRTPSHPAVVFDIELHCPDFALGTDGVSIVSDDSRAFVSTSYGRTSVLFAVTEEGATALAEASDRFPPGAHLGLSPSGALLVPARTSTVEGRRRFDLWSYDGEWISEFLFEVEEWPELVAFDVAADRMDVWLRSGPELQRRSSARDWEVRSVDSSVSNSVFALDADGVPFAAGIQETEDAWSIVLDGATVSETRGPAPRSVWLAGDAPMLPTDAPRAVLMTAGPDALRRHSPGSSVVALPETQQAPWSCTALQCDDTCFEDGIGRLGDTAAIARTADGSTWAVYVHAEFAVRLSEERPETCGSVGSCECQTSVTRDDSALTLRIVGVEPEGSVTPTRHLTALDLPLHAPDPATILEMSASPSRLALVVRAGTDGLRVLMVDPEAFD